MDATIALKRIEIVIDEEKLEELIALFNEVGVRGYTFERSASVFPGEILKTCESRETTGVRSFADRNKLLGILKW